MKKFTFIAILGCLMAAASLTSCNSDTDDSYQSLTAEQVQQCFLVTRGSYSGKMVYNAENKANINDQTDTVSVNWEIINDSTMTIYNFPAQALAENITGNDELKEAIANQAPRSLKCAIAYVSVNPIQFVIGPDNITYNVEYGGNSHAVEVRFFWNAYSFGQYVSTSTNPFQMQIWAAALYIDGNQTSYGITAQTPVQMYFYTEQ
ncbi:MAG: DUF4840 domain-containing protein [Prevotella sp.]